MVDYFIDTGIQRRILERKVKTFRLTSHTTGAIRGGPQSHSHWTIYLVHEDTSTRLSMGIDQRPEVEYPRGRLIISDVSYTTPSRSAVRYWDFPAKSNITVHDVLKVITEHGRQKYDMGDNGRGCRFWVQTVMNDLDDEGYIAGSAMDTELQQPTEVDYVIEYRYSKGMDPEPLPMIEGTFL